MAGILLKIKRRLLWKLFSLLPKQKNKIVLQSFYGRGYSDNPKAIAEELRKRGGFDLYWVVKGQPEAETLPPDIKPIQIDSAKSIYHFGTASIWVDNSRKWAFVHKAKNQYYIQTWHGFPLKRIEKDAGDALPPDYVEAAKKDSEMCNLMLSNSGFLTKIYLDAFWYNGEVTECGFPRNDLLFSAGANKKLQIAKQLSLAFDTKYILYAPTFRKDQELSVYDMDYKLCIKAFESRFGGSWHILAKFHPNIAEKASLMDLNPEFVTNLSEYPDIQDLYIVSDAMVSDYSSVMFDYIVTKKPCFLYVNDLENYKSDRNFYFDLEQLPYSAAQTNEKLGEFISAFDEQAHKQKLAQFNQNFDIQDKGNAAKLVADRIALHFESM